MESILLNLDLLTVAIATAGVIILGSVIYFNDRKSSTSQSFFTFSLMTGFWSIFNYLAYSATNPYWVLWLLRLAIFSAVWHSYFIFQLCYIFPRETIKFTFAYKLLVFPILIGVSFITLTPLVFQRVGSFGFDGKVLTVINGKGMPAFALSVLGFVGVGIFLLFRKTVKAKGLERQQYLSILVGTIATFAFILVFNFLLPAFLDNSRFLHLGALFILPFVFGTSYSIIKLKLMSIKVVATEILTFVLAITTVSEALFSQDLSSMVFRSAIFFLVLIFGIFLIKSVRKEVVQREELVLKTKQLEQANIQLKELDKQKTDFLSIAAHQLRTPLSIFNGYLELLEDGAYGKVTKETKDVLHNMDESNGHLVKLVDSFLDITRLEQGRTKYDFEEANLNTIVDGVVKELTDRAKQKGLTISWLAQPDLPNTYLDEEKVRHVVFNFVDNAIKYTEAGEIVVRVHLEKDGLALRVQDKGLGFEKVDEVSFFQKFYRGQNVQGVNVNGTGLGLYVCRIFIEAHRGKVWAHSEGMGKGSEFGFWIPLVTGKAPSTVIAPLAVSKT